MSNDPWDNRPSHRRPSEHFSLSSSSDVEMNDDDFAVLELPASENNPQQQYHRNYHRTFHHHAGGRGNNDERGMGTGTTGENDLFVQAERDIILGHANQQQQQHHHHQRQNTTRKQSKSSNHASFESLKDNNNNTIINDINDEESNNNHFESDQLDYFADLASYPPPPPPLPLQPSPPTMMDTPRKNSRSKPTPAQLSSSSSISPQGIIFPNSRAKFPNPSNYDPPLEIIDEGQSSWDLDDLSLVPEQNRLFGPSFNVGGIQWRALLYPNGNEQSMHHQHCISLFVCIDKDEQVRLQVEQEKKGPNSPDWAICAQFVISLYLYHYSQTSIDSSPLDSNGDKEKEILLVSSKFSQHRFDNNESDWGFNNFCPSEHLREAVNVLIKRHHLNQQQTLHQKKSHSTIESIDYVTEDMDESSLLDKIDFVEFTRKCGIRITISLRVVRDETGVLWHNFMNYNSKKVTGFVGFANQGATCYMNSLLQSLYFTNYFRKAIFQVPTKDEYPKGDSSSNITNTLALQRIFWRLQHSDSPVYTTELTKAFGWESLEAFIQSDVQEFSRVLLDDLETRTKRTAAEGVVEKLFVGKVRNVIRCTNVPFESRRTENFYDLQLSIKGLSNLKDSFDAYVKEELLEGDNKYHAEGFGKQDARKFVQFESLPPVLHLHLERYTFDPRTMGTVKINDRFEFPLTINLDAYLAEDSPQRKERIQQNYILQCVFVHSGDSHGGHYYVFIKDLAGNNRWFRFDDTKVIPATEKEAIEDNFGGEPPFSSNNMSSSSELTNPFDESMTPPSLSSLPHQSSAMTRRSKAERLKRFTNAYMLVYIRASDLDTVLCPIDPIKDIPAHIGDSIKAEEEAEHIRRQQRQDALMSIMVNIITDANLEGWCMSDVFNFTNKNRLITPSSRLKCRRDDTVSTLKERLFKDGILHFSSEMSAFALNKIRLWYFATRKNKTIRLDSPIETNQESILTLNQISNMARDVNPFVLYAELLPSPPSHQTPSSPLYHHIFIKFYDPEKVDDHYLVSGPKPLRIVGHILAFSEDKISRHLPVIKEMLGLPSNGGNDLTIYEEVKPNRLDQIDPNKTFSDLRIGTGDILVVQLAHPILTRYYPSLSLCSHLF